MEKRKKDTKEILKKSPTDKSPKEIFEDLKERVDEDSFIMDDHNGGIFGNREKAPKETDEDSNP